MTIRLARRHGQAAVRADVRFRRGDANRRDAGVPRSERSGVRWGRRGEWREPAGVHAPLPAVTAASIRFENRSDAAVLSLMLS